MAKKLTDQEIVKWTTDRLQKQGLNPQNWQLMAVLLKFILGANDPMQLVLVEKREDGKVEELR